MGALTIEEVLAAEADAIRGETLRTAAFRANPLTAKDAKDAQVARFRMDGDKRNGEELLPDAVKRQEAFYRSLNKLNRAALCCSGGGIRSATFCLGVVQALAGFDARSVEPNQRHTAAVDHNVPASQAANAAALGHPAPATVTRQHDAIKPAIRDEIDAEHSLLGRFHYLSTVSGGGYFGSWLSSWRMRNDFQTVLRSLTGRPSGADVEPPEISWLRAYSNYLTPRVGLTSADTWAALAICGRNLLLNWLVIIPVVCFALLILKFVVTGSVWIARHAADNWAIALISLGIVFLIAAQAFTTRHRPTRRGGEGNVYESAFLYGDLIWAILSAIAVTIFFTSRSFLSSYKIWIENALSHLGLDSTVTWIAGLGLPDKVKLLLPATAAGVLIYAIGWIAGFLFIPRSDLKAIPTQHKEPTQSQGSNQSTSTDQHKNRNTNPSDFIRWAASGLVYGALVGLGAYLFTLLDPYRQLSQPAEKLKLACLLVPMIFGVPWVLTAQLAAEIVFVGLTSSEPESDSDREWLGRAAGWLVTSAIAWALLAFLVFAGGYFVQVADIWGHKVIVAAGGVAGILGGIVTALVGSSAKTPAKATSDNPGATAMALDVVLAIAGPVFAAVLIIALSIALDRLLLGDSLVDLLLYSDMETRDMSAGRILIWLGIGLAIAFVIGRLASRCVNINRFSLHALYRNRLIRGYLGASRQDRRPDNFTGFDIEDNVRVHQLWSTDHAMNKHRLFHVINIALNVVSSKRLAWQERKAEPFTVSPLHCGSSYLGFRPSTVYGDGPNKEKSEAENNGADNDKVNDADKNKFGISLGTAMAISGAAVSPNMGYNSSPSITLLLALFNVRLGWWLGNPGETGDTSYQSESPRLAAKALFYEAFGLTTDESRFVYLSDGGHFEDLGLYEMVRRRCRFIVVIDAGCDATFAFEDLGNAVRKIYIDLGIRIKFDDLEELRNRPTKDDGPAEDIPYYAIGTIDYNHADGCEEGCGDGCVVYIKPAYHGTEGAAIRSYATAHDAFPHETTVDQWFTESQFESYRSLGLDITSDILGRDAVREALRNFLAASERH